MVLGGCRSFHVLVTKFIFHATLTKWNDHQILIAGHRYRFQSHCRCDLELRVSGKESNRYQLSKFSLKF